MQYFLKKAKIVHNNKYDYSKVNYVTSIKKVIIICPDHGEFTQRPNNHLAGSGCKKCNFNSRKLSLQNFIEKSMIVHGLKYDYSKVAYKSSKSKIIIICSEHGEFLQRPTNHLTGQGCKKCGINNIKIIRSNKKK